MKVAIELNYFTYIMQLHGDQKQSDSSYISRTKRQYLFEIMYTTDGSRHVALEN